MPLNSAKTPYITCSFRFSRDFKMKHELESKANRTLASNVIKIMSAVRTLSQTHGSINKKQRAELDNENPSEIIKRQT